MPIQFRYRRVRNITLISAALYDALPSGTRLKDMDGTRTYYKGEFPLDEPPDFRGAHRITWVGFPSRADDPVGNFAGPYRQQ